MIKSNFLQKKVKNFNFLLYTYKHMYVHVIFTKDTFSDF